MPRDPQLFTTFDFDMCFALHFDFEICFAAQRNAIFHLSSPQMAPHPAALASLLFDPPSHKTLEKHSASRLLFFSSDSFSSFSSLIFFLLLFSFLTPPTSAFSFVHIVGSLTSKLSSIMGLEKVFGNAGNTSSSLFHCRSNDVFGIEQRHPGSSSLSLSPNWQDFFLARSKTIPQNTFYKIPKRVKSCLTGFKCS